MTPSELADCLRERSIWTEIGGNKAEAEAWGIAAATIRAQAEALKIATEALVPLANMAAVIGKYGDDSVYVGQSGHRLTYGDFRRATQALARIKEV